MVVGATFERDLELSSQVLVVLVAHQETKQSVGVWLNIEAFCSRRTGAIARRDVAHRVSAGFARSDAGRGQEAEEIWCFLQLHIIDLGIFSGGEMNEPT